MAKERQVVNHEFVKLNTLGKSVVGRVTRYGTNDNGSFIVLEPIFIQDAPSAKWKRYGGAAVGLSTDLRRKIDESDKGKILQITFTDTQPVAGQPSPQKLFKVLDLDNAEATEISDKAEVMEGKISDYGQADTDKPPF